MTQESQTWREGEAAWVQTQIAETKSAMKDYALGKHSQKHAQNGQRSFVLESSLCKAGTGTSKPFAHCLSSNRAVHWSMEPHGCAGRDAQVHTGRLFHPGPTPAWAPFCPVPSLLCSNACAVPDTLGSPFTTGMASGAQTALGISPG